MGQKMNFHIADLACHTASSAAQPCGTAIPPSCPSPQKKHGNWKEAISPTAFTPGTSKCSDQSLGSLKTEGKVLETSLLPQKEQV